MPSSGYRLTIWGAAQTVTGSRHLLEGPRGALLLECGLYQGRRQEPRPPGPLREPAQPGETGL